ncbi:MAG: hypothetical protein J5919_06340 [Clostridia bacterium]|nr:hypothetical protein [Clostridia bacterium]
MKRTAAFISAILAVIFCLALLASCADAGSGDDTTAPQVTASVDSETEPVETDKYEIGDLVPSTLKFPDEKIVILSRGRDWCKDEVSAEDDGDRIHAAVFTRNLVTQDRLGVTIENILLPGSDNYEISEKYIRTQVSGGLNDYSLICASVYASIIHTNENLYCDLKAVDNLDLSRPYWFAGFNNAAEYKGSQYFCTGAICLSLYRFTFATFFNRHTFEEHNQPFLYEAVSKGEWTLDYQNELITVFYQDVNSDGVAQDRTDKYGLIANHDMISVDPYWSSCKLDILGRNDAGEYMYNVDVERISTAVEKITDMFWNNPGTLRIPNESADAEQPTIARLFAEGQSAMTTLRLIEVEGEAMKNMQDDRGVVPMPKLNKDQDRYYSYVHDTMSAYAIPNTGKSDEEKNMLGAVLEVMASESYRTITPAYYEITLKARYVNDVESVSMLDLITDSIYIDAGILYTKSIDSVHQQMRTFVGKNTPNSVATYFKAEAKKVPKLVNTLNEGLDSVKGQ